MIEGLGGWLVGDPMISVIVGGMWVALYFAQKLWNPQRDRSRWPLAAAAAWWAYALWEWLIQVQTPEANIRADLLVIYPVLALLSGWALLRSFK